MDKVITDNITAVVTGSAGYIGDWLHYALRNIKAARVTGVDLLAVGMDGAPSDLPYDVRDQERMQMVMAALMPDVVYHLAAVSQVTEADRIPALTFDTNAMGTVSVLEAVRLVCPRTRVIVVTSDKVYGPMERDEPPMAETRPLRPIHPYDASKASADLMAQSYATFYGMNIAVARLCNVYGGIDQNLKRIVPTVLEACARDREPLLRSNGNQIREYIHLEDATSALFSLAESTITGPVNIGGHRASAFVVCEMVQTAMRGLGYKTHPPYILDMAHKETDRLMLDSSKAEAAGLMGTPMSLEAGTTKTAEVFHEFLSMDDDDD